MAPPAGTLRVGRYFLALLAIFAVLYGIVFIPGHRHSPKLGLDLVGGQQVIFTAQTPNHKAPSKSQLNQAKQIMENRVNGSGVTQATVVIQGSNEIVVSIPGGTGKDVRNLGQAAVLSMRGNIMPAVLSACPNGLPAASPSSSPTSSSSSSSGASTTPSGSPPATAGTGTSSAAPNDARSRRLAAAPTPTAGSTPASTPSGSSPSSTPSGSGSTTPSSSASGSSSAAARSCVTNPLQGLGFTVPTSEADYDKLAPAQQQALQGAVSSVNCKQTNTQSETATAYIACEPASGLVYLLGPVIVKGTQISGASSQAPNPSQGLLEWTVLLNLKGSGQVAWASYTGAHNIGGSSTSAASVTQCAASATPCADFVGFVLDGQIISAPVNESVINGQTTQISGTFTQSSAGQLANELKYGALPLSFTAQDSQSVSASLGTSQLKAGLLAGGIGLVLVVLYSLIYYRALGFVTIASLLVSGGLTYGCLVILGNEIGFTLSLAGIAGFIVAVGITADSFVVFFERIKDEVHEGRSARVAIPRAWVRARRTILSADTVSFLAAAILYYFAAGDVKGFAFTLGLSTILDLVVVFLFTHPLVSMLSRLRSFGSSRITGLDAIRGGPALADSDQAAARSRPKRARGRSRPATAAGPPAVAVLEREVVHEPGPDELRQSEAPTRAGEPEPPERPPTAPEPGTAAERAAARRARLRDEKGNT